MLQDFRFAFRTLWKSPGFTAVAILALALGIGANSAIFTVVNSVVLRPLPFPQPDRLSVVYTTHPGALLRYGNLMDDDFLAFEKQNTSFDRVAVFSGGPSSLTGFGEPIPISGTQISDGFWPVLGVQPALGRVFGRGDDHAVALSDKLWRTHFSANRSVIGKTVRLDGELYTIQGVMPSGFAFPAGTDLWTLADLTPHPGRGWMRRAIGRLKPGVSAEQASAEAATILERQNKLPVHPVRGQTGGVTALQELLVWRIRPSLLILLGAVGFILLIACANVANLLLARGAGRKQEVAVRASLGATRFRLIRQLLTESMLLGICGGLFGILVASWTVWALMKMVPPGMLPRAGEVTINGEVIAFAAGLSLLTSLLFGVVPAIQMSKARLHEFLKQGDSRSTSGQGLRSALVVAEIALSLVLLIGAGLMIKSFVRLRSVNPGFNPESVTVLTVNLPDESQPAPQLLAYHERVLSKLATLPGVISTAAVNWLPLDHALIVGDFYAENKPRSATRFNVSKPCVSPEYFRAMGIPLRRGRVFNQQDLANSTPVAIVSRSVAKRVWGDEDPIGKRVTLEDNPKPSDWLTVVGEVDDVKQENLAEKSPIPGVYRPLAQVRFPFFLMHMAYVVRASGEQRALPSLMRSAFRQLDPNQPVQLASPMSELVNAVTAEPRFYSRMLGSFSAIALLLASIGIYGVMAYSVSQRTREIGIRLALGAQPGDIFRSVLGRSAALISMGVALGVAGSFGVTRVLEKLLFEVKPTDALTFTTVSAFLIAIALVASYVPAHRATSVDPMVALREE